MIVLRSKLNYHKIVINPSPAGGPEDKEQVVVDLHVEQVYHEAGDSTMQALSKSIVLHPNECIVLKTKEELEIPGDIFGFLCSRGSLSSRGLLVANTKVDPCFNGALMIPVFNASSYDIEIQKNDAFCSIFFLKMEEPVSPDARKRSPIALHARAPGLLARLKHHREMVIGVMALVTGIIALATALVAIKKPASPTATTSPTELGEGP
jgi:deoxycytidine triphosphate deaminase